MSNNNSYARSIDNVLAGVLLMLGFCITAPLLDVAAKLASDTIAVGQIKGGGSITQNPLTKKFESRSYPYKGAAVFRPTSHLLWRIKTLLTLRTAMPSSKEQER